MTHLNESASNISGEGGDTEGNMEGISGEIGATEVPGEEAAGGRGLSLLTEPLGLFGWSELETVLLAAVASETPLLLVGSHGCAKSFFLEKLASALNLA